MQRLEVSGAVRLIYRSLGVKGLITVRDNDYDGNNIRILCKKVKYILCGE